MNNRLIIFICVIAVYGAFASNELYIYENQKEPSLKNIYSTGGDVYSSVYLVFNIENDSAKIDFVSTGHSTGKLQYPSSKNGEYKIELYYNGKKIIEKNFDIQETIRYWEGPKGEGSDTVKLNAKFILPFYHHSQAMNIYKNDKLILSENLSKYLCNENKVCERKDCDKNGNCKLTEDYLSCPSDCLSGGTDKFCDRVKDGICDADCAEGIDKDCKIGEGQKIITLEEIIQNKKFEAEIAENKKSSQPQQYPSILTTIVISSLLFFFFIIVLIITVWWILS